METDRNSKEKRGKKMIKTEQRKLKDGNRGSNHGPSSSVYVLDDELGARKVINNVRFLSCPEMSIILQCYSSMCH